VNSVMVFGGTGFIGRHLVRSLLTRGERIILLTRRLLPQGDELRHPSIRCVQLSEECSRVEEVTELLVDVETIYNLAGDSHVASSNLDPCVSLDGICRIQCRFLDICARAGTQPHVVYASSRLVYGAPSNLPVTENTPIIPRCMYAAHKSCVEHYLNVEALRGHLSYSICRVSNPYGPESLFGVSRQTFINSLISKACRGNQLTIYGPGSQLRDYLHVSDLVDALILCGTSKAARDEIFNIGRGKSIKVIEAAGTIAERLGVPVIHTEWPIEAQVIETGDYVVDVSKAARLLGFKPQRLFLDDVDDLIAIELVRLASANQMPAFHN